ncbi:MAG: META domain-containing protein [Chloroflexota bacterium]
MSLSIGRRSVLSAGLLALLVPAGALAQSPSPAVSPATTIEGVDWHLVDTVTGGVTTPVVAGSDPWIHLEGGALTGDTGCNPLAATYSLSGTAITITLTGPMTRMCIQGLDAQQQAILAGLTGATTAETGAGTLALVSADGTTRLDYAAAPAVSIEGPTWVLLTPGDQKAPERSPTLTLQGGSLSGQAPCNQYNASYTLEGSTLSVGPIMSTKMACPDLDLETAYLAALQSATGWSIDASGDLVLTDASGAEVLRYTVPTTDD